MRCKATKKDGSRCLRKALSGDFCAAHDPSPAAKKKLAEAGRKGGSVGKGVQDIPPDAPDVLITDTGDVIALLSETLNRLRRLPFEVRVANAIGALCNVQINALRKMEIEDEIRRIKEQFGME